jgi:ribosomal protein S18 acetylase RimI-like enzyme
MRIAVDEDLQNQGIGKRLIAEAVKIARQKRMTQLEVGTGNSSLDELAFYQKAGFGIVGVGRDFFVRNYEEEIIENGSRCVDMVRLTMRIE